MKASVLIVWVFVGIITVVPRIGAQTDLYFAPMTINNLTAWYSSNGGLEIGHGNSSYIPGATFPPNTAGISYASGFMYVADTPELIANGAYYGNTFQQGAIRGMQTGNADDKYGKNLRIWRVRKDFATADLRRDAALTNGVMEKTVSIHDMQQLRNQYKQDWIEWPWMKGAPYYDVNKNGIYDPKFIVNEFSIEVPDTNSDAPGIADADQVIWYVCNDLGAGSPFNTQSIGMEMQITIWGFRSSGALNNTLFRRCKFIYKGTAFTSSDHVLKNMYVGIWSDLDIGISYNDLAGSDSLLGLGYFYNSRVRDPEYTKYNTIPPSAGYDILQGPVVKGTSVDSALVNFSYRRGWKNLPVTAITYTNQTNKPVSVGANGAVQLRNALNGFPTNSSIPRVNPFTQLPTTFWASGDPISRTGWIDGVAQSPGERDMFISTGPFSMTLGDTQDIVTAFIAAQSPDIVASVGVLKYYDKIVQEYFSHMVSAPPVVPLPKITVRELDRSFLFEWEKDDAGVNQTENFSSNGYRFEGYELFQLKSPNDPRSEWRLLATFDWMNEVTQIVQEDIDPSSGRIALIVKHHGSNSGIVRYIQLTYDSIRNAPFVNGQQYHFAFAAYAAAGDGKSLFRSIESEPQIVTVVPHQPNPETHLPYAFKDSLLNVGENIVGNNDARLGLRILDPYSITGGLYDIWYGMAGASSTWTVVKNKPGTEYATISTMLTASELIAPRPNPLPTTTGTAEFTLNDARDRIAYSVNVATDNTITSIEFYSGQINTIGILVKKITTNSKTVSGVWTMNDATDPFTSQMLKDFVAGYLFVLVRTVKYPKGEMRGQLTNGMIPRATLPIADYSTSDRSVMTFQENRFPNEGFSLFVSPAPIGFRSGTQIAPSTGNVINQANKERTYSLIGPGYLWGASRYHESVIEFRFAGDTNWAISTAKIPAETKFIRVPFQVFKDSVRIVPVIENTFATDSLWNVDGNSFLNGQPLFDKIVGLVDTVDFVNNDISYNTVFANGTFPSSNSMKGRLINGVNHIARNIQFVNVNGGGVPPAVGTVIRLMPYKTIKPGDIKRVTVQSIQEGSTAVAQKKISSINVFPNPYYGVNIFEKGIQNKYVTFSHLPRKAVIKVFNLAGISVRTIVKDTPEQFITWDLKNHSGNFVSSGIYLVYIEMENIGTTVLKLAVIMEQQQINNY